MKVAKAESYLLGGYHNECLELTYYIETLFETIIDGTQGGTFKAKIFSWVNSVMVGIV